ncbi:MAG TPA: tetratricopeptide repeat protein [Phenylobacterium sp.]|nr:tetratricopeptide repeat protein [Phenylobacterium sp.]
MANATDRFRARDAAGAETLLRRALAAAPDHAPSLSLLGLIAGRAGRDAECVALLERAVANGAPEQAAAAGLLLGAAHHRAGRKEASVAALRAAVAADPGLAAAQDALASALYAAGDFAAAVDHAERAVALAPQDPGFAGNLAVARNAEGRFAEAAGLCRAALGAGEDPALLNTLGVALKELGDLTAAGAGLERALALSPGFAEALYNLAAVRKDEGRTDEAVRLLREVVALRPDLASARFALVMAHLPPLYRDAAEVELRRADYSAELNVLADYVARVDPAALAAGVGAAQPFHLAYQGRHDDALQRHYGEIVCQAMAAAFPAAAQAAPPRPGERLRIGVVCGYLRDHSVWRLPTRGWVAGLDRSQFELIAFHTGTVCDAETERARALFDRFVQGPLTLADWRGRIVDLQPHALIYPEVGMDPMAAQLAALRLAPAQYGSWGHPSTTGYPTLDFYLSSDAMEPPGAEARYTETLVRLPGLSTICTLPLADASPPARSALGLPDDAVVYWCGQSLYKYLPQHDGVFAEIAARVPNSRFIFIEFPGSAPLTQRFRDRLAEAFARRGLDAERCCAVLPRMGSQAFRAAMGCADVMLDSIGWSGCNSVLDAFARGLPVVTLPGDTMRSRHAAAMLREIGLDRLVCETQADYVETAVALGLDGKARKAASEALADQLPRLNQTTAIAALAQHLIGACRSPAYTTP